MKNEIELNEEKLNDAIKLKTETPLKTVIRNLSHEGRGVSNFNQKTLFVDNALPGEEVTFEYHKKHRRYDEAKSIEILNPSKDRVPAKCAHFNNCGGCSLQHMERTAQLKSKEQMVLEQLQHFGKITPETVYPPIMGPAFAYRQKARLGVRFVKKKEKVLVGFHERNSNKVAEIDTCEILHPQASSLITPLKDLISTLSIYTAIPQIELAVGEEGLALVFRVMETPSKSDLDAFIQFAKEHNILIYLQEKGPESLKLLWPESPSILIHYTLPKYNLRFAFSPLDFTQVNQSMNQMLVERAIELLNPNANDIILDLFCGLGNFTLPLSRFAKKVVGIEGNEKMVERATKNAALNHLTNTEFMALDLQAEKIPNLSQTFFSQFNKILLDPPRTGAEELMRILKDLKHVDTIVYVSCNPASFARDLGILLSGDAGYFLKAIQVFDMFPQTTHVESLALLQREKNIKEK